MKKLIYTIWFITVAFISFNCKASNVPPTRINNHVYTAPSHAFEVNIPYIQLSNKRVYMNVTEGATGKKNFLSYWIDFSTPPQLKSIKSTYMYITLEWNSRSEKNLSDRDFYNSMRKNVPTFLDKKIRRLFNGQAVTKFISNKQLKINGRAAYQLIVNIHTTNDPNKSIKGIFTFINFYRKTAFISILPVLPVENYKSVHDEFYSHTLHWNEYNQVLYSLKSG